MYSLANCNMKDFLKAAECTPGFAHRALKSFSQTHQDHTVMEGSSNNTKLTDTFYFYLPVYKIYFRTSRYRNKPQVRSNGLEARQNPYHIN